MFKRSFILIVLALALLLSACATPTPAAAPPAAPAAPANPVLRMSTTTSVNDSGLMAYLQPVFEADTGYKLEITSAGSGTAIEKGRTGDADILLVHSKAAEEEFTGEGFDEVRIPFMTNYFIVVGPEADPAGVKTAKTAAEAFKRSLRLALPLSPAVIKAAPTRKSLPSGRRQV